MRHSAIGMLAVLVACREHPPALFEPTVLADRQEVGALATTWKVTLLTNVGGWERARSWAINDSNIVVGSARPAANASQTIAWRWRNGVFSTLAIPNATKGATARGINRSGDIVGWLGGGNCFSDRVPQCADTAFHRATNGVVTRLPKLQPGTGTAAYDINDKGQVVGFEIVYPPVAPKSPQPLRWSRATPNGPWLAALGSIYADHLVASNNSGTAAGAYGNWPFAGVTAMTHSLVGQRTTLWPTAAPSCASDINNGGLVVGMKKQFFRPNPHTDNHIVYGVAGNMMYTLEKGDAFDCFEGPRISDKNRIVGTAIGGKPFTLRNGIRHYLPLPFGATSGTAHAVNSCGVIAGSARFTTINKDFPVIWRQYSGPALTCD